MSLKFDFLCPEMSRCYGQKKGPTLDCEPLVNSSSECLGYFHSLPAGTNTDSPTTGTDAYIPIDTRRMERVVARVVISVVIVGANTILIYHRAIRGIDNWSIHRSVNGARCIHNSWRGSNYTDCSDNRIVRAVIMI